MVSSTEQLGRVFRETFARKWENEDAPEYCTWLSKFVFHMSDATEEICRFAKAVQDPGRIEPEEFAKLLHRFFLDAVPHLMAAGELYDYIPQTFPEQRGVHTRQHHTEDVSESL